MSTSRAVGRTPLQRALVLLAVTASGLAAVEAARDAAAMPQDVALTMAFPIVGAGFVVVGAFAWVRRPANQTGLLLCITGLVVLAAALADGGGPAPLSDTGVLLGEAPIAAVLHVVLAFPSGRVATRRGLHLVGRAVCVGPGPAGPGGTAPARRSSRCARPVPTSAPS